ncbi:MAG: prenyltransferase [Acidimicrobiaceae bacterium]|nr:prenyltransferase [Acidimicrobiaceae bacterium]
MPPEPRRQLGRRSTNGSVPAAGEPGRPAPETPEVAASLSRAEADRTADTIAALQLSSGMIPRFAGGVADPWNHVEAAMALTVAGRRAEADAAYEWLARIQRPDGSWHQYYTADGVDQDKLDANTIAYIATGVWHHWLCFGDAGYLAEMWPVVQRALDFVLGLQTPRGEILWARHADGTPWPFALLTGSSSISHSLRCGLAIAHAVGEERPSWELALARLVHTVRHYGHDAFAPKDRWAMDWYYPVLAGVLTGSEARARMASRRRLFVHEGEGVRCVSNQDWVTTAETCECVLAYLAAGDQAAALELFEWVQRLRESDGSYLTGRAFPAEVSYPDRECSTYSAAAVLLAADALAGDSPTSGLFVDLDALPAPLDLDPVEEPARD